MKPCLLIPDYDHKDEIGGVIDALAFAGIPRWIVDEVRERVFSFTGRRQRARLRGKSLKRG